MGRATVKLQEIEAVWRWLEEPENIVKAALNAPDIPKLGWAHRKFIQIRERGDEDVCAYCNCELTDFNRTIDHVVPRVRAGSNHLFNLVLSCQLCNSIKADKLVEEWTDRDHNRSETRRQRNDRKRRNRAVARVAYQQALLEPPKFVRGRRVFDIYHELP